MRYKLLVALFATGLATARAQPPSPPPPMPTISDLTVVAGVTSTQLAQFTAILDSHQKSMESLRRASRNQEAALRENTRADLAEVLTTEQLKKFDEWTASNRRPSPPAPPVSQ